MEIILKTPDEMERVRGKIEDALLLASRDTLEWIQSELQSRILEGDHIATGYLLDSITVEIDWTGRTTSIIIDAPYFAYFEYGRKQSRWPKVPKEVANNIMVWLEARGMESTPSEAQRVWTALNSYDWEGRGWLREAKEEAIPAKLMEYLRVHLK